MNEWKKRKYVVSFRDKGMYQNDRKRRSKRREDNK